MTTLHYQSLYIMKLFRIPIHLIDFSNPYNSIKKLNY